MSPRKGHAFAVWIVLLCLLALLGVALLSYGCTTWNGAAPLLSQEVLPHV